MRRRGFRRRRSFLSPILFILLAVLLLSSTVIVVADAKIQSQLNTIAGSRAKNISTSVINKAVIEVITDNNVKYDDLVRLEYDTSNMVSAIKTDSIAMNRLQSAISDKISERIAQIDSYVIAMPLGNFTNIDFFSNWGPIINISVSLSGNTTSTIENVFESAGINQTRHQINLAIKTNIFVLMSAGTTSAEVLSHITIAETIIVGHVPEYFASKEPDISINNE